MKVKNCHLCLIEESVMYRVKINIFKDWIFVCKTCCIKEQKNDGYKYGGTWKGVKN